MEKSIQWCKCGAKSENKNRKALNFNTLRFYFVIHAGFIICIRAKHKKVPAKRIPVGDFLFLLQKNAKKLQKNLHMWCKFCTFAPPFEE